MLKDEKKRTRRTTTKPTLPAPLQVILPLPPSVNDAYADVIRSGPRGLYVQRVPTAALLVFKQQALREMQRQHLVPDSWKHIKEQGYAAGYTATIYVPTRASDLDNRLKGWQDVLFPYLGINDNRSEEMHVYKRIDPNQPRVIVNLFAVRQAQRGEP